MLRFTIKTVKQKRYDFICPLHHIESSQLIAWKTFISLYSRTEMFIAKINVFLALSVVLLICYIFIKNGEYYYTRNQIEEPCREKEC